MNAKHRIFLATVLCTWLLGAATSASASVRPENITDAEWALVPPFCPHTMGFKGHTQPHIAKWQTLMGKSFFHMHHYCWALIDLHRAERAMVSDSEKRFLRRRALGGFKYVVDNAEEDFVLLPEIFTWIGRTDGLLGNVKSAGEAFAKAWTLKPDYWPPYYHWAELLKYKGKKADAMEVVKTGLSYAPGAQPLLLLFRALGGKPSDLPPPIGRLDGGAAPKSGNTDGNHDASPAPAAQ